MVYKISTNFHNQNFNKFSPAFDIDENKAVDNMRFQ